MEYRSKPITVANAATARARITPTSDGSIYRDPGGNSHAAWQPGAHQGTVICPGFTSTTDVSLPIMMHNERLSS